MQHRRTPRVALAGLLVAVMAALSGCADYILVHPTPTPNVPIESLPPIGYNHRYGNNPVAAADGLAFERYLFTKQVFWEVGVRADPQIAGFVDRSDPAAVVKARTDTTALLVSIATERLHTIQGMLAFPTDAAQEQYCIAIVDHFRAVGYSKLTKATVLVFFTESDEHAVLTWTPQAGYKYVVNDGDLKGNSILPGPSVSPLPSPQ